jgi:transcriptional regulator with XRE-family HTH domain
MWTLRRLYWHPSREAAKMISLPASGQRGDAAAIATNLRRLMARHGLTFVDVVEATGLDERTIRGLVRGSNHPHARTLHKLAHGLGIEIDELFHPPGYSPSRQFDRATNTLVQSVVAARPELFENWSQANFDELYSRFGAGGQLTESGVLAAAEAMNAKRDLWRQISVIFESGEAELLTEFVNILFHRATTTRPSQNNE